MGHYYSSMLPSITSCGSSKETSKIYSFSKQFCTRILFSYIDRWCQFWLVWKGSVRRIPFSKKNECRHCLQSEWALTAKVYIPSYKNLSFFLFRDEYLMSFMIGPEEIHKQRAYFTGQGWWRSSSCIFLGIQNGLKSFLKEHF